MLLNILDHESQRDGVQDTRSLWIAWAGSSTQRLGTTADPCLLDDGGERLLHQPSVRGAPHRLRLCDAVIIESF